MFNRVNSSYLDTISRISASLDFNRIVGGNFQRGIRLHINLSDRNELTRVTANYFHFIGNEKIKYEDVGRVHRSSDMNAYRRNKIMFKFKLNFAGRIVGPARIRGPQDTARKLNQERKVCLPVTDDGRCFEMQMPSETTSMTKTCYRMLIRVVHCL